ncbi:MAG: hypothetical protein CL942_08750 [Desulfovibrio sp.]|nr:hypothetical protein [Desulfovibrio sp.]|tara:strand:+ start:8175 stop:10418 length:2244 start_codon:yes stop_codon:yes gene_type:complete
MNDLEVYFQNEYKKDFQELEELDSIIKKVLHTFSHTFSKDKMAWPYKVNSTKPDFPEGYSTSTNSMILTMVRLAEDRNVDRDVLFPKVPAESVFCLPGMECPTDWSENSQLALEEYRERIVDRMNKNKPITSSATYGDNDPLSLLWCAELFKDGLDDSGDSNVINTIKKQANRMGAFASNEILEFPPEKKVGPSGTQYDIKPPEKNVHSFISLRLLQLIKKVGSQEPSDPFDFFERRLHLHLSYSDIPDSRFDPAELVFSLEGALRSKREAVSQETIQRAFEVLEAVQNLTPYWRPINPIYATAQGQILLPLSVEVANSLLRICCLLDHDDSKESLFSKHSAMFKRYFRWLKAQIREVDINSDSEQKPCWGWASEHVGGENEIHLFQTSEILCFLINYRHILQDRIARRSLEASGLKVEQPIRKASNKNKEATVYWDNNIVDKFEPIQELGLNSRLRIYSFIGDKFIKPRNRSTKAEHYSMLLYGPPGTGKSTVGENIAKALKWKFITVTPSDFLAGGAGEVEARAKAIFKCLEEQKDAVILFDEIDQFLLDRETSRYREQTGIFQFMTPGMLPKINDLRKRERSIFIIATNYEERIDPAIKRKGRVDFILPLMPPAYSLRKKIVTDPAVAKSTAGCTFKDLKGDRYPSIKLDHYRGRLYEKDEKENISIIDGGHSLVVEYALLYAIVNQDCEQEGFKLIKDHSKSDSDFIKCIKHKLSFMKGNELHKFFKEKCNDPELNELFESAI